jgi:hypothetical protein
MGQRQKKQKETISYWTMSNFAKGYHRCTDITIKQQQTTQQEVI